MATKTLVIKYRYLRTISEVNLFEKLSKTDMALYGRW